MQKHDDQLGEVRGSQWLTTFDRFASFRLWMGIKLVLTP